MEKGLKELTGCGEFSSKKIRHFDSLKSKWVNIYTIYKLGETVLITREHKEYLKKWNSLTKAA